MKHCISMYIAFQDSLLRITTHPNQKLARLCSISKLSTSFCKNDIRILKQIVQEIQFY